MSMVCLVGDIGYFSTLFLLVIILSSDGRLFHVLQTGHKLNFLTYLI